LVDRVISWFSCGAASAVATKLAIANADNVVVAYCKVQEEHPDNERFLKECEEWFGQEIVVLMNETYKGSIYNVFEKNYMRTPSGSPCTRALKKQVRQKFELPTDRQVFGYTIEEEARLDRFIDANNDVDVWPVLIERGLSKNDCLAMVNEAGIELPDMYKLGYRNNNCIGCVKGGMGYWNKIRVDFPDHFKRMADLEKRKGYTVLKDKDGPIFLHDLDPNRGDYSAEHDIECGIFCHMAQGEYQ
jgi:hypothetical protein